MAEDLEEMGLEAKRIVIDTWYFALKLITRLRDLGLDWVTRTKKNRLFTVNRETVHAEDVIHFGVKETVAELPKYYPVKLMVVEINDKWRLLVASDPEVSREEVVVAYVDLFQIENPFFRNCKQEMGLADFHTRRFRAFVAHTVLCFLSQTWVSLVRLLDEELVDKSVGLVKESLFRAVAGVRWIERGLAVVFGKGIELVSILYSAIPV